MRATAASWPAVERVLDQVLDLPTDAWPDAVAAACGDDPALREAVESLLRQAADLDGFLDGPAARVTHLFHELAEEPDRRGARVGPWRIDGEVGRGGMGVVYRASRADGRYDQIVALKVLRTRAAGAARRFALERQVLAGLDHPGLARLLDAGETEDGRPFLVMEFVEGEAIDRYCERRGLAVEARIRLLLDACDAVAYAHRHLVVHRDLKPSNLLVAEENGRPRVKLLDFGIARLLGETGVADPAVTLTLPHARAFTPAYAAPEQMDGRPPTTATDVFGLGVVLFELLTGRRPFRRGPGADSALPPAEAAPPRPSSVAPAGRAPQLAGDLDAIVGKALRPEPEARYATASDLAADLRRHLDGRPVEARKGAAGYRLRKFAARHRAGLLSGFLALVVVAAVVALAFGRVTAERDRAAREAAKAQAVAGFLASLFEEADPDRARGDTLTVFQLLDAGAARVGAEFAAQPGVQAELLRVIADTYQAMGDLEAARAPYTEALAVLRAQPERDYAAEVAVLARLVALLRTHGRYDEALPHARDALHLGRTHLAPTDFAYLNALNRVADLHRERGALDEAEVLFEELLPRLRRGYAGTDTLAGGLNNYAILLQLRGRYDEALALHSEALALRRAVLGDRSSWVGLSHQNLAALHYTRRAFGEALAHAREADAIYREVYGPVNPYQLTNRNMIGRALTKLDRYADAEPVLLDVLAQVADEPDSPHRAWALLALADIRTSQGRWEEAERMMTETDRIVALTNGPVSAQAAGVRMEQARLAQRRGAHTLARARYDEALGLYRRVLDPAHPRLAEVEAEIAATR